MRLLRYGRITLGSCIISEEVRTSIYLAQWGRVEHDQISEFEVVWALSWMKGDKAMGLVETRIEI